MSEADRVLTILRREGRSLFQYLREVPPWANLREQHTVARLRELAAAELAVIESLSRWVQKQHEGTSHLGAFPDFTGLNDTALHYLLPMVVREQTQHLLELERERPAVTDSAAGAFLDQLLELKRRHGPELDALSTPPHTFTTVNV